MAAIVGERDGACGVTVERAAAGRARLMKQLPLHAHVPKYLGHRGWIGVWLDTPDVDWAAVREALLESYRMTAPKTLAAKLRP